MDLASVLVALALGGGVVTAFVAYRKSGPETESLTVATMKYVIEELRLEVTRLREENEELRRELEKLKNWMMEKGVE